MHIAIDASRITVARRTGTERYALELLRHLLPISAPNQLDLYFRDAPPPDLLPPADHAKQHIIPWPRMWTHTRFAAAIWSHQPDVTFVPAHTLPFIVPGQTVVTLHDVGYVHFPQAHPTNQRRYLHLTTAYSARRATRIIADSYATKRDLIAHYHITPDKISVVYPGVDQTLTPVTDRATIQRVQAAHQLPDRYLLFIGTLQPRKNIARMVQAYHQSDVYRTHGVHLLLGGGQGWLYDPSWTANIAGVRELGYVPDADLATLYSGALAFVFPSLYEGFGFPILEAMRCHTPVITSNTSSLPELAGEAALLVDPADIEAIAHAIRRMADDATLRDELVQKGQIQSAQFTWQRTAQQTLAVLIGDKPGQTTI